MAESIDQAEPFAIVGVSFGGMVASEMNKVLKPEKTILISSASCRMELPAYFRGAGKLNIIPRVPSGMLQLPDSLLKLWSPIKDVDQRALFLDIVKKTDREFLKWAVQSILTWDNDEVPPRLSRIHGRKDRILPMKVKADSILEGGHMIVLEQAKRMAELIQKELN
jgi:pimeloyl-ACP methyl ester carboxylesterase